MLYKKLLDVDTLLGVAQIEYSVDVEMQLPTNVRDILKSKKGVRRVETAAVYTLLYEMVGDNGLVINHLPNGRPLLDGYNISISHTKGYVAIIISRQRRVSVDIEYRSDRVCRIADRFMCKEEKQSVQSYICCNGSTTNNDLRNTLLMLHWCAKETMYKYYSDERLTFMNMMVSKCLPFSTAGTFECHNLLSDETLSIDYIVTDDYVLTYTYQ